MAEAVLVRGGIAGGSKCTLPRAMTCPASRRGRLSLFLAASSSAGCGRLRSSVCCSCWERDGVLGPAFSALSEPSCSSAVVGGSLVGGARFGTGGLRERRNLRLPVGKGRAYARDRAEDAGDLVANLYTAVDGEEEEGGNVWRFGEVAVPKQLLFTILAAGLTISFSVSNKILYKMALVPMARYPFFLAQLTTFGYVAVYFTMLYIRHRAGIVTKEMLELPKSKLAAIGGLEALAIASGMASAAVLPGAAIPILAQVYLVWQLLLSYSFLGKRYTLGQLAGCLLVIIGVVIVVASGSEGATSLQPQILWSILMIVSTGFSAAANILKEAVFQDASRRIKGGVDIFVVNSFGSGFQALFVLLLLPFLSNLRGIPFRELPMYFRDGAACFLNAGSLVAACDGAPLVPLLYIFVNLSFNIAALTLLKRTSAIVASLVMTLAVPLGVWSFTLNLPYLGPPSPLPTGLWFGAFVLVSGLAAYNYASQTRKAKDI